MAGTADPREIDGLVETIHQRSDGESRQATGGAASNLDLYQVNCTFYDALGRNDNEYLIARALQFFAPGVPQVYYVGLLAGANDMKLLQRTRVGRDINRHYYTRAEVEEQLARPVVQGLLDLIRVRNQHQAFGGEFHLDSSDDSHCHGMAKGCRLGSPGGGPCSDLRLYHAVHSEGFRRCRSPHGTMR